MKIDVQLLLTLIHIITYEGKKNNHSRISLIPVLTLPNATIYLDTDDIVSAINSHFTQI